MPTVVIDATVEVEVLSSPLLVNTSRLVVQPRQWAAMLSAVDCHCCTTYMASLQPEDGRDLCPLCLGLEHLRKGLSNRPCMNCTSMVLACLLPPSQLTAAQPGRPKCRPAEALGFDAQGTFTSPVPVFLIRLQLDSLGRSHSRFLCGFHLPRVQTSVPPPAPKPTDGLFLQSSATRQKLCP